MPYLPLRYLFATSLVALACAQAARTSTTSTSRSGVAITADSATRIIAVRRPIVMARTFTYVFEPLTGDYGTLVPPYTVKSSEIRVGAKWDSVPASERFNCASTDGRALAVTDEAPARVTLWSINHDVSGGTSVTVRLTGSSQAGGTCRATPAFLNHLLEQISLTSRSRPRPHAASPSSSSSRETSYVNSVRKWSISYPQGWGVDTQNLAFVRILPTGPLQGALVGIHAGPVNVRTADELMDLVLDAQQKSSLGVRVLSRQSIQLADGTPALLLDTELGSGTVGRSRRLAAVVDGIGYVIDAETYRDLWPTFEPYVTQILKSFRVNR